jgi:hypothetical protein
MVNLVMSKRKSKKKVAKTGRRKPVVGWREWVGLPDLGIDRIKAKFDTGARTSAIHAFGVEAYETQKGQARIRFHLHPRQHRRLPSIACDAEVKEIRQVTNSGGLREPRFVIETTLQIGDNNWPIELTLSKRDEMGFRMLVGRTAIRRRFVVDPGRSYLVDLPSKLVCSHPFD